MAHSFTFSTIAALAVAGIGSGLYLGKSAVDQIDPVYFSSPYSTTRFHADLVPNRPDPLSAPARPSFASVFDGLGNGCVGCRTYPEEYIPIHDPAVDGGFSDAPTEVAMEPAVKIAAATEESEVERYTHFQVAADETAARLPGSAELVVAPVEESPGDCEVSTQCEGDPTPGV